jgi:hypothetical protein
MVRAEKKAIQQKAVGALKGLMEEQGMRIPSAVKDLMGKVRGGETALESP